MPVPVSVKIIDNTTLFVKYSDGLEGNITIKNISNIENSSARIDENSKNIFLQGEELCKNAIYKQLNLKSLMHRLKIDISKI